MSFGQWGRDVFLHTFGEAVEISFLCVEICVIGVHNCDVAHLTPHHTIVRSAFMNAFVHPSPACRVLRLIRIAADAQLL